MKDCLLRPFQYFLLFALTFALYTGTASAAPRPTAVRLSGHVPSKAVSQATLLNPLDASTHVPVTFVLPLRNQEALKELISRIYDPNDEHYGKYLTSAEFNQQFAPTQRDYNKVVAQARRIGLTITSTHPNRTLLNVSGSARNIEKAFNLRLHEYQSANGRKFYAPNNDPEVSIALSSVISGIVGLDNHAEWHPFYRVKKTAEVVHASNAATETFPSGPGGGYAPSDLVKAYNLSGISANGSGQSIALFELASYKLSDITTYASQFGLPSPKMKNILVDGGSHSGIDAEVTLDIQLALALAPESLIYVYEGPNSNQGVLDTYNRIATDNLAKQVSTSWGLAEDLNSSQSIQAENAIFQQMAAQGQTIYAAAGDSGAYDDQNSQNPTVDDPASQPYVCGVGGTSLNVNADTCAYESEAVWNNGSGNGAGGGGVSTIWPIPSWQTKVSNVSSTSNRNVPDVALNADTNTGYAIFYDGQWNIYGGTSCAAPLWAAFTALVNQDLAAAQKPALGFVNPVLYAIGTGSSYSTNFNDVTTGDNLYYSAQAGYDNASGWGSFNGANLFASLTNSSPLSPQLQVHMKHNAPFKKGGVGIYEIQVSNQGTGSTTSPVTVVISLPTGLSYKSFTGAGWSYNAKTHTFKQSNALPSGANYPIINLNVNVSENAPHTVTPSATVSGGGSPSSTVTDRTTTH